MSHPPFHIFDPMSAAWPLPLKISRRIPTPIESEAAHNWEFSPTSVANISTMFSFKTLLELSDISLPSFKKNARLQHSISVEGTSFLFLVINDQKDTNFRGITFSVCLVSVHLLDKNIFQFWYLFSCYLQSHF